MEAVLPIVGVALLMLACPLMMVAIGGVVWLVSRVRGEKKEFSPGCMPGHGGEGEPSNDQALNEKVAQLEGEIESLRAQSGRSRP